MVKMYEATEHAFETVLRSAKPTQEVFGIHARFQQLVAAFGEAYEKPSTSAMYIAGEKNKLIIRKPTSSTNSLSVSDSS